MAYQGTYGYRLWRGCGRIGGGSNGSIWESSSYGKKRLSGVKEADLGLFSYIEYGVRVGLWRLMEVFDRQNIKCSIVLSGLYTEMHPEIAKKLSQRGDEIAAHGCFAA